MHIFIILFFQLLVTLHLQLHSEGFVASTYVNTPNSQIPIAELVPGDSVLCCDSNGNITTSYIVDTKKNNAQTIIFLELDESAVIGTTPDQTFFVFTRKSWVPVQELECGEYLSIDNGLHGIITKKYVSHVLHDTYCISVAEHSNFFINNKILVHNFAVVIPICVWTIGEGVAWASASTVIGAIGVALLKEGITKFANKLGASTSGSCCGTPPPPEDPNNRYTYRYGRFINDATYHHNNSAGLKSPPPADGQIALDNSYTLVDSKARIAIENGAFVMLHYTSEGIYHGHKCAWEELPVKAQRALQKAGRVNHRGKIIN